MLFKVRAKSAVEGTHYYNHRLFLVKAQSTDEACRIVIESGKGSRLMGNYIDAYPIKFDENGICHLQSY